MIADFHETDDPNQISTYAGMMTTAFALAEFSTGALWGRVSDRVGRKPVILIALFGTAMSMLLLGVSPSIWTALLSRVLAGLLNGAILLIVGAVLGALFMKETNPRVSRRDPGLEFGNWMLSRSSRLLCGSKPDDNQQRSSAQSEPSEISRILAPLPDDQDHRKPPNKRRVVFNRQVVLNIASYGILAYHTMTFDQLFPMVLSTETHADKHLSWPFKFVDGYGMNTKEIGFVLSVQGIYSLFATAFLFPFVVKRTGPLQLFKWLALTYWILYFFTPYAVLCPDSLKTAGVYAILVLRCSYGAMAYPSNAIHLINSVTDMTSLGTINGIAASTASLSRAFSPAASGYLYTVGLEAGYSGLPWWFTAAVTLGGSVLSVYLMEQDTEPEDVECDEETGLLVGLVH
ncbi:hypothetical protein AK830_g9843 [Neonectria ditissima]|uniref:Major facilitator superfamily (MFS) profile domain-containing protein n=1 Tax=Neonectria ditissima TaxID=78410 RepID=A0A0P7AR84_9HYPO|nr:hypothetical protein AK830_g9843 [Neonectria ditissima]